LAGTGTQGQVTSSGFAPNSFLLYKNSFMMQVENLEGAYEDSNADGIINANDKYVYKIQIQKQFWFCVYLKLQKS
jgi:iron complex outermembrane receptor protein